MTASKFLSLSPYHTLNFTLSLSLFTRTCRMPEMPEMPKLKLLCAFIALQSVISLSAPKLMSFENYLSLSLFTFLLCVAVLVVFVESGYGYGSGAYLEMKVTHSLAANNFARRIHVACYEFLRFYYTIYYRSRSLSTC